MTTFKQFLLQNTKDARKAPLGTTTTKKGAVGSANRAGRNTRPEPEKRAPIQSRRSDAAVNPNDPSTWRRVSRNALCSCGSGKKYKHCHGKVD